MPTPEEIAARLEALKKARASGLRSVSHRGRSVEYRSDDELKQAIADLETELAAATGKPRRRRVFGSTVRRGT